MPTALRTTSVAVSACAIAALAFSVRAEPEDDHDIVLSFSTVGDSRQDPKPASQDPTTQPISPQDAIWLQNTKAWSRIMRSIEDQRSNFLFFDGDMIMGY